MVYAVIDTNVLLSALITKNPQSATIKVIESMLQGDIIPLYHADIIHEYGEVLRRDKFHVDEALIQSMLGFIVENGVEVFPQPTGEILIDIDDLIFYEVAMEKREDRSYLVTGNQKHFPQKDFIVTPAEMMDILHEAERDASGSTSFDKQF